MLHAFNATTGNELFAYIPNGVCANLIKLINPYYNEQHQFYVNGSPQAGDVQFSDGTWHTVLVGGERAGGSTIFALDVTNPADHHRSRAALRPAVLWEFTDPNMGLTFSTPAIAADRGGASGGNWLHGVLRQRLQQRRTRSRISTRSSRRRDDARQGASTCARAVAGRLQRRAGERPLERRGGQISAVSARRPTTLYAGDLQGNVWRVDIHDANPPNWIVHADVPGERLPAAMRQPITTTPLCRSTRSSRASPAPWSTSAPGRCSGFRT